MLILQESGAFVITAELLASDNYEPKVRRTLIALEFFYLPLNNDLGFSSVISVTPTLNLPLQPLTS